MDVTERGPRAPTPPVARLHDSKLYGLRTDGDVQSDAAMAPVVIDMLPSGQALTAVGSFSLILILGQKYPMGHGEQLVPTILVPGRQMIADPELLGNSKH
jgi:hypothetical protein